MSVLIVQLPVPPSGNSSNASADYHYVQTRDGLVPEAHGTASAATLPSAGLAADVVAVLPFQAISWHTVDLPKGALSGGQTRLRAVLDGLLEDRLLDEPSNLHLAISPHAQAGQPLWVAACDKAWLKAAIAPLEAAGRPVSRIVPEFTPSEGVDPVMPTLHALGDSTQAWLVRSNTQGVLALPRFKPWPTMRLGNRPPFLRSPPLLQVLRPSWADSLKSSKPRSAGCNLAKPPGTSPSLIWPIPAGNAAPRNWATPGANLCMHRSGDPRDGA